jgi:hypothetical protein
VYIEQGCARGVAFLDRQSVLLSVVFGEPQTLGLALSEETAMTRALFYSGETLGCLDAADVDNTGEVEITDPISLLNFLFVGGVQPPPPYPLPGQDPEGAGDGLDCERGI